MKEWTKPTQEHTNIVLGGNTEDSWFLSYQPMTELIAFGAQPETAICIHTKNPNKDMFFFILEGDWREEYTYLHAKGLDACLEFYEEHNMHWSGYTDNLNEYKEIAK